jgi:hypothetical protein
MGEAHHTLQIPKTAIRITIYVHVGEIYSREILSMSIINSGIEVETTAINNESSYFGGLCPLFSGTMSH